MNSGINKYISQIQRLQKIYGKNYTALSNLTALNPNIERFVKHQERMKIGEAMASFYENHSLINNYLSTYNAVENLSTNSFLETINKQNNILSELNSMNSFNHVIQWNNSISNLIRLHPNVLESKIDNSAFKAFGELITDFLESPYYEMSDNDIPTEITVNPSEIPETKKKIKWKDVIDSTLVIINIIASAVYAHESNIHHQEKITELEKQTNLLEEQVELQSKFNDKFDIFIETYINDHPNDSDADQ